VGTCATFPAQGVALQTRLCLDFLEKLVHDSPQPVILVAENHSSHKSQLVMDYVKSTDGKLELHYIPPYAAQLNPDEQVWKTSKDRRPNNVHLMNKKFVVT